jgi:hypothetical protein
MRTSGNPSMVFRVQAGRMGAVIAGLLALAAELPKVFELLKDLADVKECYAPLLPGR